jgi:hypothetical protein
MSKATPGEGRRVSAVKYHDPVLRVNWGDWTETIERALRLPEPPTGRWNRRGISPRGERVLDVAGGLVLLLFTFGWSWSIAEARAAEAAGGADPVATTAATATIAAALTDPDARSTAFLTDAALETLEPLRGESGRLRVAIDTAGGALDDESHVPDTLPTGTAIQYSASDTALTSSTLEAPEPSGVWQLALKVENALRPIADLSVITLTPLTERKRGRIGLYYVGTWPTEKGRRRPGYSTPSGLIEVTRENRDTPVSDHFELGDFLTHGQETVWPKYLVLDTRLVDKLELVIADLEQHGTLVRRPVVMSGFRTPQYNVTGGDPRGRASLSRHMYGDASDIFVDNDGNGRMDDLNHDGRVDMTDARVILAAVDRVERLHPALVGGAGVYAATAGHGPFIHIDTRGYRARWVGTGDG